jgi:hypothetical protein
MYCFLINISSFLLQNSQTIVNDDTNSDTRLTKKLPIRNVIGKNKINE